MTELVEIKPHVLAGAEIDGWRGRCIDLFAKGERAIGLALETAQAQRSELKIRHLAGQRLADLKNFVPEAEATERQRKVLQAALDGWGNVEKRRSFFAHGVSKVLLDSAGKWHVQLDFRVHRTMGAEDCRWNLSKAEALKFEKDLDTAFEALSAQLGQFRKRLTT